MVQRITRWTLTGCTLALWMGTVAAALNDAHMKIYMTTAMATFLVTSLAIAVWLLRSDHLAAAVARNRIRQARLDEAFREEAQTRDDLRHLNSHSFRHVV